MSQLEIIETLPEDSDIRPASLNHWMFGLTHEPTRKLAEIQPLIIQIVVKRREPTFVDNPSGLAARNKLPS
jgi:hypothetical protein